MDISWVCNYRQPYELNALGRELQLNLTSIDAVSVSSVKNVLWPAIIWSFAPIRTKTWSIGDSWKLSAGTSAPTWINQANVKVEIFFFFSFLWKVNKFSNKEKYLGQNGSQAYLTKQSWLSTHVGTGEKDKAGIIESTNSNVIGNKHTLA